MGIIEILTKVGEDNIKVQPLHGSVSNVTLKGKSGSQSTFSVLTQAENISPNSLLGQLNGQDPEYTGIILWVKTDKLKPAHGHCGSCGCGH